MVRYEVSEYLMGRKMYDRGLRKSKKPEKHARQMMEIKLIYREIIFKNSVKFCI